MNDPIVDEVRRFRDQHSKQFDYDIDLICKDYRQKHDQYVKRLRELSQQDDALGETESLTK